MKKRLFAVLLVVTMVIGMIPVIASAEGTASPEIQKVNMTLGGILEINFKVDAKGADMSGCSVKVTIGADATSQNIADYTMDGDLYVYTAKLPAHRIPETLKVELLDGATAVQTKTDWTVESYLNALVTYNPDNAALADLKTALLNYGAYAAYYAKPTGTAPADPTVEAVEQSALTTYKMSIGTMGDLGATAALYIDDACDIRVKFDSTKFGTNTLLLEGKGVALTDSDTRKVYHVEEILPQDWSKMYSFKVVDTDGAAVMEFNYSVLSYAYVALGKSTEAQTGLNGLLKAMYLYHQAAVDYMEANEELIENGPIDENDGPVIEF